MNWTYEEGLRFECARDLLTDRMGECSASIAEEMQKLSPDSHAIARLREERLRLSMRRDSFHVGDSDEIEKILNEFASLKRYLV